LVLHPCQERRGVSKKKEKEDCRAALFKIPIKTVQDHQVLGLRPYAKKKKKGQQHNPQTESQKLRKKPI